MTPDDSDRPPVLAHQRFVADKESFVNLNLAQRFRRIHDTNLWGAPESASGLGSELDATAVLRVELPRLFRKLGVTSLLDAPCGDAGWISRTDLGVHYVGVDIVPSLIESLQARAAAGDIKGEYHLADITADTLPRCDAILCRDCLVHLSFANIERAVANFRASGAVWLIATTFPRVADQCRLRGRRLARAEFRARAVQLGAAGRIAERELPGGRRRLARQEPWRVAVSCTSAIGGTLLADLANGEAMTVE